MTYNIQLAGFAGPGGVTFNAEASGVRQEPNGNIGGPEVHARIARNGAGTVIDLDGTSDAVLSPPQMTFSFRFVSSNPAGHTQYNNLISLKGKHGTLSGRIFGASSSTPRVALARLIDVQGSARGWQRVGMQSVLVVTATWQLKGFLV